jgi:hypothetical protein
LVLSSRAKRIKYESEERMPAIQAWIEACKDLKEGTHFKGGRFFPGDEDYLIEVQREVERKRPRMFTAREEHLKGPRSGQFHFDLGAVPYVGNLRSARIFLFMINPGVNQDDYADRRDTEVQNLFEPSHRVRLSASSRRGTFVPSRCQWDGAKRHPSCVPVGSTN